MTGAEIILASASPRRLELLRSIGLCPRPIPSGIQESGRSGEAPREAIERLARQKADHVVARLKQDGGRAFVLGADTAILFRGDLIGKPADPEEATRILRLLAGEVHEVVTALCLIDTARGREAHLTETTRVRFRNFGDRTVAWYVASGEPFDKAGAYGIQGRGALLAESVEGSWTNVVGLPLERLPGLFREVGVDLLELVAAG